VYRTVKILNLFYEKNDLVTCNVEVALCSETRKNTKSLYEHHVKFSNVKSYGT